MEHLSRFKMSHCVFKECKYLLWVTLRLYLAFTGTYGNSPSTSEYNPNFHILLRQYQISRNIDLIFEIYYEI